MAEPLNGVERLKILHDVMNMDTKESFHFHYGMVAKTGLQTKDFIAPTGFDFRNDSYFRMGQTFGCVSYLQITSPELTDKLLADLLDLEENLIINMHLRPIDPKWFMIWYGMNLIPVIIMWLCDISAISEKK